LRTNFTMSSTYLRQPFSRSLLQQAVAFGGSGRLHVSQSQSSTSVAHRTRLLLSTLSDSNEFHSRNSHPAARRPQLPRREGRTYDTCALPKRGGEENGWDVAAANIDARTSTRLDDYFSNNSPSSTTHSHEVEAETSIILVVGGPASGKTLLCDRLAEDCGVDHICAADLLKEEVATGSPLGVEIADCQRSGQEIPGAIILALIRKRIRTSGDGNGRALLTGFPRNEEDAEAFFQLLGRPELALSLDCDDTMLLERELSRTDPKASSDVDGALRKLRRFRKEHKATINLLREHHVPCINLDGAASEEGVWNQLLAIGRLMQGPAAAAAAPLSGK
jgi:adenylate kinase